MFITFVRWRLSVVIKRFTYLLTYLLTYSHGLGRKAHCVTVGGASAGSWTWFVDGTAKITKATHHTTLFNHNVIVHVITKKALAAQ